MSEKDRLIGVLNRWDDERRYFERFVPMPEPASPFEWVHVPGTGFDVLRHDSQGIVDNRFHQPGTPDWNSPTRG